MKEIELTGKLKGNFGKNHTYKNFTIPLSNIISALEKEGYVVFNKEDIRMNVKQGLVNVAEDLEEVELSPLDCSIADFQDVADNREAIRILARNQERLGRRKG